MKREDLQDSILKVKAKNLCLKLSTGTGKTKLALEYISNLKPKSVLIVVPRLVLIQNTIDEVKKWHKNDLLDKITFVTYVSLPKHEGKSYDVVMCDEAHHLSERAIYAFKNIKYKKAIFLSATITKRIQFFLDSINTQYIELGLREAIDEDILPDPKVFLLPLDLPSRGYTCFYEKKPKKGSREKAITIKYEHRWNYKNYGGPIKVMCTPRQYYNEISGLIEWYKKKSLSKSIFRNTWLHKAGERLRWLSDQKIPYLLELKKKCKNYRTLVFCNSIEQTELLGNSINSKVGLENLDKFNNGKIKFISSCNILNEGCNLNNCKIGIFGNLNSSELLVTQRNGRLLRHKDPIIIVPYFRYTREEELLEKMLKNYNSELITVVKSIDEIKL